MLEFYVFLQFGIKMFVVDFLPRLCYIFNYNLSHVLFRFSVNSRQNTNINAPPPPINFTMNSKLLWACQVRPSLENALNCVINFILFLA